MIEMSKWSSEKVMGAYSDHSGFPEINSQDDLWKWLQKNSLQEMTDIMESGDLDALEVQYLTRDSLSHANLTQRNRNMALQIGEFMKSGKRHFCIAGTMHMTGPSSIVSLLRQSGYKVERLIVEEPLATALDDYYEGKIFKFYNRSTLSFLKSFRNQY